MGTSGSLGVVGLRIEVILVRKFGGLLFLGVT